MPSYQKQYRCAVEIPVATHFSMYVVGRQATMMEAQVWLPITTEWDTLAMYFSPKAPTITHIRVGKHLHTTSLLPTLNIIQSTTEKLISIQTYGPPSIQESSTQEPFGNDNSEGGICP